MPFKKGEVPKGATPFEPGKSGNPNGRPEGAKTRATVAKKVLEMEWMIPEKIFQKLKELFPGIEQKMTVEDIIYITQAHKAIKRGDHQAAKFIIDSRYGAPKQEMEMVGEIKITDHKISIEVVKPIDEDQALE